MAPIPAMPFSEHHLADHPISLYAATKRANELMAHSYAWLYGLPATGLRFFTVYGPWGRPDMAMWIFAKAIAAGKPIQLFNHGNMRRDFTYVDDVTAAMERLDRKAAGRRSRLERHRARSGDRARSLAHLQYRRQPHGRGRAASSSFSRRPSAARRSANICPCSPATCPRRAPMRPTSPRLSASSRRRPSRTGSSRFVAWYRQYHGLD